MVEDVLSNRKNIHLIKHQTCLYLSCCVYVFVLNTLPVWHVKSVYGFYISHIGLTKRVRGRLLMASTSEVYGGKSARIATGTAQNSSHKYRRTNIQDHQINTKYCHHKYKMLLQHLQFHTDKHWVTTALILTNH